MPQSYNIQSTSNVRQCSVNPKIGIASLSDREVQVLIFIARGYSRREIGSALTISQNTAAAHIANVYRKLSISTIAEATHAAIRHGLVRLM